ncbi:MAG: nitroreductase family protein [Bdellovibrionales bacterium]|nr:nitroreductase family protein [Bdellovibrionales bacterium]
MADDIFKEIPDTGHREQDLYVDFTEFEKVLKSRRSVRVYKDEQIPSEVMSKILDSALLAPNSSNLQPWEFHWVKSKEVKEQVVKACLSQPAAATASELIVCVGRTKTWKKHSNMMLDFFNNSNEKFPKAVISYYEKIVPLAYNQGPLGFFGFLKCIAITFRGFFKPTPREPVNSNHMKIWAVKSTALACENIMLTARALGYDSCPMEGYDSKMIKKILSLPRDAVPVMVISLGKKAETGVYGHQIRFPKENFIKIH